MVDLGLVMTLLCIACIHLEMLPTRVVTDRQRTRIALTQGRTDCILTFDLSITLIFNPSRAMVMTHTRAKGQGHRSFDSKVRKETWSDRWKELIVLPSVQMWSVTMHLS